MTRTDLNELRRLHAAASQADECLQDIQYGGLQRMRDCDTTKHAAALEAARAAHAALPALVQELERLEGELEAAREGVSTYFKRCVSAEDALLPCYKRKSELMAERDALRREVNDLLPMLDADAMRISNLRAENERLRKDVRRLREERDLKDHYAWSTVKVDLIDPSEVPEYVQDPVGHWSHADFDDIETWLKERGS